jgi:predicted enzyme related to lactoylglutathione lyase
VTGPSLGVVLVGSADPARLRAWYAEAFGSAGVLIDKRDVADRASEPGRVILTFAVDDITAAEARLIDHEVTWIREVESTPLGRIGTVIDADGNYVQVMEPARKPAAGDRGRAAQ